ncbi:TonB-dependent receptor plug domain-containing protein [Niabella hibiscisoli]|uniref:TonB-dependent receptor plug domain-containing protein n=1 Tax=Niabella hibiscisoli TaxID=1825928 RepID=UPI001F0E7F00|nr:TonB-dependent receptor plug domain-containing protein [Niabella hibiscisoli]MCH5718898.1 carboxypeptidase-like regulatory domain-containing protein [Niabella hibiscisoli]
MTVMLLFLLMSSVAKSAEPETRSFDNARVFFQTDIEVSGLVTDSSGTILPGVTVMLKSKQSYGTTTDLNGRYILKVPSSDILEFRMVGYLTQEVAINGQTTINITLQKDYQKLDDVVVTAFGQRARKRDLIGSVSSINPGELRIPASNLTTALQGRIAGMVSFQRSGEPGADNADFFIRGVSTFGVNQRPLMLVDNMEVTADDLARIPVDDIEGFSILRDATASAVYGSRGQTVLYWLPPKKDRRGRPKSSSEVNSGFLRQHSN